jgi:hypothetical protein
MTVEDLIKKLQEMPQYLPVVMNSNPVENYCDIEEIIEGPVNMEKTYEYKRCGKDDRYCVVLSW